MSNDQQNHQVANIAQPEQDIYTSTSDLILRGDSFDRIERFANMMAKGTVAVPNHFRGKPGDCLAVTMQAMQWRMNPFAVAQKSFIGPNGTLQYEAQLVHAAIVGSGALQGDPKGDWFGEWEKVEGKFEERTSPNDEKKKYIVATYKKADEAGLGITVSATLRGETEPRTHTLMLAQCYPRFSTQWANNPKLQIWYAAMRQWARLHKPSVILGVYTEDEIAAPVNMGPAEVVEPASTIDAQLLAASRAAAAKGVDAYNGFWKSLSKADKDTLRGTPEHEANKETATKYDERRTVDTQTAAPKAAPAAGNDPADPSASFDDVLAKIQKAPNEDALYVAMDWADAMNDADQARRPELEAAFNTKLESLRK